MFVSSLLSSCYVSITQKDPVTLWTNGGPGVSGLTGMFLSLGPFRPMKNGSLRVQPYSWVNVANMLFVEQPAGVGFSVCELTFISEFTASYKYTMALYIDIG